MSDKSKENKEKKSKTAAHSGENPFDRIVTENPFARSGSVTRSPPKVETRAGGKEAPNKQSDELPPSSTGSVTEEPPKTVSDGTMDGPSLTRAIAEKAEEPLPGIEVARNQLDVIIRFAQSKSNISKDLKQALLKLRHSLLRAREAQEELGGRLKAAEKEAEDQRGAFPFAAGPVMSQEALRHSLQLARERAPAFVPEPENARKRRISRPRRPGGAKRRAVPGSSNVELVAVEQRDGQVAPRPQIRAKRDKQRPKPKQADGVAKTANSANVATTRKKGKDARQDQGKGQRPRERRDKDANGVPWTIVANRRQRKGLRKEHAERSVQPPPKRDRGCVLLLKTEATSYADVLKSMRSDEKLSGLGADVRSVRRTRAGEMLLILKKGARDKGPDYKKLTEEVIGESIQVKSLTTEVAIQGTNLDLITTREEFVKDLKKHRQIELPHTSVRLRKGPAGTQVVSFKLPVAEANKLLRQGPFEVGWSMCSVSVERPPIYCFKCFEPGHRSFDCRGKDRSKLCRRCGKEGHKAQGCNEQPKCCICAGKGQDRHFAGSLNCPGSRRRNRK